MKLDLRGLLVRARPYFPTLIDRYLISEVVVPFMGGVVFLSFVFLMSQFLRLAEFFIVHRVSIWILLEIAGWMIVSFLPLSLPVSFLIAILSAFGRLSADSELVAMKSNGISIHRLALYPAIVAIIMGGVLVVLNQEIVPRGELTHRELIIKVGNTKATASIKEGTFTTGFFGLLIYTERLDRKTNRMYDVFLYDERDPDDPLTILAKEGEILSVENDTKLSSSVVLKLFNGAILRSNLATSVFQKVEFNEYKLYLTVNERDGSVSWRPRILPQAQLLAALAAAKPTSGRWRNLRVEQGRRLFVGFTPLLFVFLGIGFGTVRTRAVRASAALIGLGVVVLYWGLQAIMISAAMGKVLPPMFAMMVPNLAVMILAIRGYRSALW